MLNFNQIKHVTALKFEKAQRASKEELVTLNTKQFDVAFSKNKDQYIGKGGHDGIKGRYERFEDFILNRMEPTDKIEASEIYVHDDGRVEFTNGRHRYAWLRDNGFTIKASIPKECIESAKKYRYIK